MGFVLVNNKKEANRAVLSALNMPERQLVTASFLLLLCAWSCQQIRHD